MTAGRLCGCAKVIQESFFGTAQSAELSIHLGNSDDDRDVIRTSWMAPDGAQNRPPTHVYNDTDAITGRVNVALRKPGSRLEHLGIKVELIGDIDVQCLKKGRRRFYHCDRLLAPPGELTRNTFYDFAFDDGEKKPHETYTGVNVTLRYCVRVTLLRRFHSAISVERDVLVHVPSSPPEVTRDVKTELGIGDQLRIEFACDKWRYELNDVISGSIYFLSVTNEIEYAELQIVRREMTVIPERMAVMTEKEVIVSHEVLDGSPPAGDCIPLRLYLSSCLLTPTMRNVEERFSVKYFINLAVGDVTGNRFFKQQEIALYRRASNVKTASDSLRASSETSRRRRRTVVKSAPTSSAAVVAAIRMASAASKSTAKSTAKQQQQNSDNHNLLTTTVIVEEPRRTSSLTAETTVNENNSVTHDSSAILASNPTADGHAANSYSTLTE